MFSLFSASRCNQSPAAAGFSLIELLVSIGIIVLVLSIVMTQQGSFNSSVLLRSQTYEVALALRDAQLSSVSATNDATGGSENFRQLAGVYLNLNTPDRITYFRDTPPPGPGDDSFYQADEAYGPPELFDPRFELGEIRPNNDSLTTGTDGNDLVILFERPNFDALFFRNPDDDLEATAVEIDIVRTGRAGETGGGVCGEDYRTVEITTAGQITVQDCP